jgi:transcriptional regulator with XRE-family HTH domain
MPPSNPVQNRLEAVMAHINWYLFAPVTRLARDAGVSHSSLSRVLSGQSAPSFSLACKVTHALEKRLGVPVGHLDPRELFSLDGSYPTACTCALVGCPGCRLTQTSLR